MPKIDYSHWLSKQQAADAIGVSTKTLEKLAAEKQIEQRYWKRPETGAQISVYNPDDVNRIRLERNPDATPFVLPRELAPVEAAGERPKVTSNVAEQFLRTIAALSENSQKLLAVPDSENSEKPILPPSELSKKLYLTEDEAAAYTGLGKAYLRANCEGKTHGPRGAFVYKRSALDKL